MTMDGSITAKDKRGGTVFTMFQIVLNFYLNAAASEAIDCLGRHVWVKQRSCDHEEDLIRPD
jgi:hypothetical protein